jgi:hypothetical protein
MEPPRSVAALTYLNEAGAEPRTMETVHMNVIYYSHVSVTFWVETIFD